MSEPKEIMPELSEMLVGMGGETFHWCMQCGLCFGSCPWRQVSGDTADAFNTRKLMHQGQLGVEVDETLYACTTCGICVQRCPRQVSPIDNIRAMRGMLAEAGTTPSSLRPIVGSLRENGNPWMGEKEDRNNWTKKLDFSVPSLSDDHEYLLYVCCTSCYDSRSMKIARAVATALKEAGINYGILGDEVCCGESCRKIGEEELFMSLAQQNIELFNQHKVKKIIVTSPHCLYTFRNEYPELGGEYQVEHYSQTLARLLKEGKLSLPDKVKGLTVAFHDPCYLGRHSDAYDEPRQVLAGLPEVENKELTLNKKNSLCCGGGGGRVWIETPPGERFGDIRVKDAVFQEADIMATACPYCTIMMEASNIGLGTDEKLRIRDIAELVCGLPEEPED